MALKERAAAMDLVYQPELPALIREMSSNI